MMDTSPGPQKVQSWNGRKWSALPSPSNLSDVQALSCSSPTDALLTEKWNRSSWSVSFDSPNDQADQQPDQVSCPPCGSTTSCVLTEDVENPQSGAVSFGAQVWNGVSWQVSDLSRPHRPAVWRVVRSMAQSRRCPGRCAVAAISVIGYCASLQSGRLVGPWLADLMRGVLRISKALRGGREEEPQIRRRPTLTGGSRATLA